MKTLLLIIATGLFFTTILFIVDSLQTLERMEIFNLQIYVEAKGGVTYVSDFILYMIVAPLAYTYILRNLPKEEIE